MTTLAQPFAPITFQEGVPGHPFAEPVGTRGRVVVFESQYRRANDWNEGLLADLTFLASVEWGECYYGAMDCSVYGFVCDLPTERDRLADADVLRAIKGPIS